MFQNARRVIEPELLDDVPLAEARASLRDLVRINRYLGGHEVLRKSMRRLVTRADAFTFLDVGAASGDMGDALRAVYPNALVTSLDYRSDHLRSNMGARVVGDAFHLPFVPRSFDFVHCSLFLHHFADERVVGLLKSFGSLARKAVVLSDLERHPIAYAALPWTRWLFGWDPITLHDGPVSVQAAFHSDELEQLARAAGLRDVQVRRHRPSFRLELIAAPGDEL